MDLRQRLYPTATRVLPASFFEKRQARQAQGDVSRAGVVFIHVPRTAGLSVIRTVYRSNHLRHYTVDQLLNTATGDVLRLPRFTIVRNPWDRAVSAYLFARQGGVPGGGQMLHPHRYRGPEFATFATFVREYLAVRNVWKLDGVFRPQSYYLGAAGERAFDHIGNFDRLGETENWLSQTLGETVNFVRSNSTVRAHFHAYYDDELQKLVSRIYKHDIERFGFEFCSDRTYSK